MSRQRNRYVGDYLIEHSPDPEDAEPFTVYHLSTVLNDSFSCATISEAEELISKVEEFRRGQEFKR